MVHDRSRSMDSRQHVQPFISRLTLRTKHWFEVDGQFAIGEGGIELLAAVAREGSLARGAMAVGWSYRHAWGYLRRAEKVLGTALIVTRSGKGHSRGAELTTDGQRLLTLTKRRFNGRLRRSFQPNEAREDRPMAQPVDQDAAAV